MFELERLDHVAITVTDLENSVKWYTENLGLEHYYKGSWDDVPVMLGKGGTCLALFRAKGKNDDSNGNSEDKPVSVRHIAFRADRKNFEEAKRTFKEKNIEFHIEDHGIAHSLYLNDPDGYNLEITTYQIR